MQRGALTRGTALAAASAATLILLGLRPVGAADRFAAHAVGWLAVPYLALGDAEVRLLGTGSASDPARAVDAGESLLDLRARELAGAIAASVDLKARPGLPASVVRRDESNATLVIDRGTRDGLVPGQPVTYADALVGLVHEVEPHEATVRLVFHRDARIVGRTREEEPQRLVVGGSGEGLLRVEVSERREWVEGAVVEVAPSPEGALVDAAVGFVVGRIRRAPEAREPWVVPPGEAAAARLLQVIVRTGAGAPVAAVSDAPEGWEGLELSLAGDVGPGRATILGRARRRSRSLDGCAVAFDGWLVGRVVREGGPAVRVQCVEDPGFEVDAILLPPEGPPLPLGLLRTERGGGSRVSFAIAPGSVELPLGASGPVVTGNALRSVPKGLRIGDGRVEEGRLVVERAIHGADLTTAFVATREEGAP